MKKKARKSCASPSAPLPEQNSPKLSECRWVVLVDEGPIRAEALKVYHRAEKDIAKARVQLETFETADLPSYTRWEASVFGAMMSEARDIALTISQHEHILYLVDEEVMWTGCSRVAAYRRVMKQMSEPLEAASEDDAGSDDFDDVEPGAANSDEPEHPKIFGDSDLPPDFDVTKFDRMSRRQQREIREAYDDMAELFSMLTGLPAPDFEDLVERERRRVNGEEESESSTPPPETDQARETPPPSPQASRLKELYRTLVRQLHPDRGHEQTARERDLWTQLQEAYKARDLEWMEAIAGRLEMSLKNATNLSIYLLYRMTHDLWDALKGLQARIRVARANPAWQFAKRTRDLPQFEAKRRRILRADLDQLKARLAWAESQIKSLSERAARPPKPRKKKLQPTNSRQPANGRNRTGKASAPAHWTQDFFQF